MTQTNESGRSMVEMLGVLAIIGVLSVGGIAGYTMAMRSYQANEILQAASMLAMEARLKEATLTTADIGIKNIQGLSGNLSASWTSPKVTVTGTATDAGIGNAVCAKLTSDDTKLVYTGNDCSGTSIAIIYNYAES